MQTTVALDSFMARCQARGLSPGTMAYYRAALGKFADAYAELPETPEVIEEFLGALQVGDERRHGYFRALKCFYRFLARRHGVPNAVSGVEAPRRIRKVPRSLSMAELVWLLSVQHNPREKRFSNRDRALLMLLSGSGLRPGEASALRWDGIREHTVVVEGKTGQREVPLLPEAKQALLSLYSNGSEFVFIGKKGNPLTSHGVSQAVKRCFERAGLGGKRSRGHTLRHTFATRYIAGGGDAFSLQRILGHASLSTTRRYVELSIEDTIRQHYRYSPLAGLKGGEYGAEECGDYRPYRPGASPVGQGGSTAA